MTNKTGKEAAALKADAVQEMESTEVKEAIEVVMYRTFEPVSTEKLGLWSRHFSGFDEIIGYSSLGHFFLRNHTTQEYIVLHPLKAASKSYGKHDSI